MKNAWGMLKKIVARKNVDEEDLHQVGAIISDTGKIFETYKDIVEKEVKKLKRFSGNKKTAEENLEEYRQKLFDLQHYLEICFIADQFRLKAEIAEIAVRRKINPKDPKIDELISELKVDIKNSYSHNTSENL